MPRLFQLIKCTGAAVASNRWTETAAIFDPGCVNKCFVVPPIIMCMMFV